MEREEVIKKLEKISCLYALSLEEHEALQRAIRVMEMKITTSDIEFALQEAERAGRDLTISINGNGESEFRFEVPRIMESNYKSMIRKEDGEHAEV